MKRPVLVFLALLTAAMLVMLPLRAGLSLAGLDAAGVAAQQSTGTVLAGRLVDAGWRGAALGDLRVRLAPLALAQGLLRYDLDGAGFSGGAFRSIGGGGITGANGRLAITSIGGLAVNGVVLDGVDLRFSNGACAGAGGRVALQPGGGLAGFGTLAGDARCDGREVLLPLATPGGEARIDLRIAQDGRFRAQVAITQVDEAMRPALLAAGFQPTPLGLGLAMEGTL